MENVDIGGPTMVRSAAKNVGWVTVCIDPKDYSLLIDEIKNNEEVVMAAIESTGRTGYTKKEILTEFASEQVQRNERIRKAAGVV